MQDTIDTPPLKIAVMTSPRDIRQFTTLCGTIRFGSSPELACWVTCALEETRRLAAEIPECQVCETYPRALDGVT